MAGYSAFLSPDDLRRLEHLALGSRRVAEGGRAGRHRSPLKGASVEFAAHRNYVKGDNLRHLDWRVHGRSERYFIKEFHEETCLRATIVLDASASMGFSHAGRPDKFTCARKLAAAIAYLTLHQQDAVGLVVYDTSVRLRHAAKTGGRHVRQVLDSLAASSASGHTDTRAALEALAAGLSRRGLILMISDLLDAPDAVLSALAHFRRRGNDVMLWQILDPAEIDLPFDDASDFIDMETGERMEVDPAALRAAYREAISAAMDDCRARCGAMQVDYRLFTTGGDPIAFLQDLLAARANHLG